MLKNGNTAGYSKLAPCVIHISKPSENCGKSMVFIRIHYSQSGSHGYSSARIFFGRAAVMAKALGTSVEEEHRNGLHKLAQVRPNLIDQFNRLMTYRQTSE